MLSYVSAFAVVWGGVPAEIVFLRETLSWTGRTRPSAAIAGKAPSRSSTTLPVSVLLSFRSRVGRTGFRPSNFTPPGRERG